MKPEDREHLDEAARLMLEEAVAARNDRIFSASGFAHENISILHQQQRCINLAWALRHTKRINAGNVIAIVGGSFSGIMLAASIAIANDAIVYLFEKEKRLLARFLDKSHRYVSPNLNSRNLGKKFSPEMSRAFFEPPIFRWSSGIASDIAAQWLAEFKTYQEKLPIFTFLGLEVSSQHIKSRDDGLTIDLRDRRQPHLSPLDVDLLIDATGFGDESNPHSVKDFSYWESGHRLIYDHLPKSCEVLVSGCGDSGLIEALHYAIEGFRQEFVEDLWPYGTNFEAYLDQGLEHAKLEHIQKGEEVGRYGGRVISEICWWLDGCYQPDHWKPRDWSVRREGPHALPIFRAIEDALRPRLASAFPKRKLNGLQWGEREAFVLKLPMKVQLEVRNAVRPIVENRISIAMASLMRKVVVGRHLRVRRLRAMARPGVRVTINGTTPTPYTRQLSTYNVWLMRVLTSLPNVTYRPGRISKVEEFDPSKFRVTFDDGSAQDFDRVVTRYGPSPAQKRRRLSERRSKDPHDGNWLLTPVQYHVRTSHSNIWRVVDPAVHCVSSKVSRLRGPSRGRSKPLDKSFYVSCVLSGPGAVKDEIYGDPQAWLSAKLRAGVRPKYQERLRE